MNGLVSWASCLCSLLDLTWAAASHKTTAVTSESDPSPLGKGGRVGFSVCFPLYLH